MLAALYVSRNGEPYREVPLIVELVAHSLLVVREVLVLEVVAKRLLLKQPKIKIKCYELIKINDIKCEEKLNYGATKLKSVHM